MVRIFTDSAADLEPMEYEALSVTCIPLAVTFDQTTYLENTSLTKKQFYTLLTGAHDFPRTAHPSPYDIETCLQEAKAAGEEALLITLSSGISGFYNTACMVRKLMDYEGCEVFDSKTATGGQRILVETAAKLRDEGLGVKAIVEKLHTVQENLCLYACIDTLSYLHQGGRIGHTAYTMGTMANLKPIITVSPEGRIDIPSKALGMRKGMLYMSRKLSETAADPAYPLYVMFTGDDSNARILWERLNKEGYDIPESRIINVGAAIGSHIGPNGCGIVYVKQS